MLSPILFASIIETFILDCRLRQTANARHSVGYKNKIIDREIYHI